MSRDRVNVTAFARSLITDLLLGADRHQFISQYGESSRYISGKQPIGDRGSRPTTARSIGQTAAQGALYSALFNIASGIGRIAFGVVADFMTGVSRSSC